jgi:hypothetical protein
MIKIASIILFFISLPIYADGYSDKIRLLGQHGIPYFYNEDVEANIEKWQKNENANTSDILGRSVLWFHEMEVAQKTNGLPWFIKFIPAANTGYNHLFDGKDGNKGMWPLSFAIGKKYGLTQNSFIDMRRDVEASSDAACKYLSDLHNIYKDWLKTITAFRIGAIRLNQVIRLAGNSLDFNDIYKQLTPTEREPIVQFYAAVTVMYFRHEFKLQETYYPKINSDTVSTTLSLPYVFLEEKLGITPTLLKEYNPQFTQELVPCFLGITYFRIPVEKKKAYNILKDSFQILLNYKEAEPEEIIVDTTGIVVDSFPANIAPVTPPPVVEVPVIPESKVWVWYRIKEGDNDALLADIFDCSAENIRMWNGLKNQELLTNRLIKFYVPISKAAYYKELNTIDGPQKTSIAEKD